MSSVSSKARNSFVNEWRRTVKFYTASLSVFKGSSSSNKVVGKKDIQNETLPLMSVTVVRNIIDNLKSGEWSLYSIIANENTDASNLE